MIKKMICTLLTIAVLMTASLSVCAVSADDAASAGAETSGVTGDCTWSFDSETGELKITGSGRMADFTGQKEQPWKDYSSKIKTITVASGVTYVGKYCFAYADATSIFIADSVTEIGDNAFYYADQAKTVKLSSKLRKLGRDAFMFSGVESLTVPSTLREIGLWAFYSCKQLKTLTISDGCACEFSSAFESCEALETVYIGKGAEIGDRCFAGCKSMKEYTVSPEHETLSAGGKHLFNTDHTKLIFYCNGNGAVKSEFSSRIVEIGAYALKGNPTLTTLTLPAGLKRIGAFAFASSQLTNLTFLGTELESVGEDAFNGTPWYKNQPEGLVYAASVAYKYKGTAPQTVTLKAGTKGIADRCFYKQTELKTVNFPSGLVHIGDFAFYNCENLTGLELPGTLKYIGKSAFWDCKNVTRVILSDTVTELGDDCFYGCSSLTQLRLSENLTYVPRWSFAFCTSLEGEVVIPESVKKIGWNAFYRSYEISYVTVLNRDLEFELDEDGICLIQKLRGYHSSTTEAYCKKTNHGFIPIDPWVTGTLKTFLGSNKTVLSLKNAETGRIVTTASAADGTYTVPAPENGKYRLIASKKNHVTREYGGVWIENKDAIQNVELHPVGDVDGDGEVTTFDYAQANAHAKGVKTLTGYSLDCGDVVDHDGEITTFEAAAINAHAKGVRLLWQ